jgi:hypothetical protein
MVTGANTALSSALAASTYACGHPGIAVGWTKTLLATVSGTGL